MTRFTLFALGTLGLAGCGGRSPTPTPHAEPAAASGSETETVTSPPTADSRPAEPPPPGPDRTNAAVPVLVEGDSFTLDDASVDVYLDIRGVLHVGPLETPIEGVDASESRWQRADVMTEFFDGDREAVLVTVETAEDEDPPNHFRLYLVHDNALHLVFDQVVGSYGQQSIALPGEGSIRYIEDGWTACDRLGHPQFATQDEVVWRLDASGLQMEATRAPTRERQRCGELAACPHVYRLDGGREAYVGEVLRNLRTRAATAWQPLTTDAVSSGRVRFMLREERPEVTYLDALFAEVAGVRLDPVACQGQPAPPFCAADDVPLVLREGDALEVVFEVPPGLTGPLILRARGYYVPTPTARTRR